MSGSEPVGPALTFGRQSVAPQGRGVPLHGVEARGDQHQVRGELVGDGHHHAPGRPAELRSRAQTEPGRSAPTSDVDSPEGSQVLCVPHGGVQAPGERHVHVEARPRAAAHLTGPEHTDSL